MKDFRVHSLDAKYVGPFEHLSIEFKEKVIKDEAEVHIFTGENGTGKSTILYLLASYPNRHLIYSRIKSNYNEGFRIKTTYNSFEEYQNKETYSFHTIVYKLLEGANKYFEGMDDKNIIANYFYDVVGMDPPDNNYGVGFPVFSKPEAVATKYSSTMFAYSGYRKIDNPKLDSIKEISDDPLKGSLNFATSSNAQLLLQWIANVKSKEALLSMVEKKEEAKKYKISLEKLQFAISKIIGGEISFEINVEVFDVFVIWNGVQTTFEVLPDGLKSIISWLGDLLMRLDRIEWQTEMDIFDRNFVLFLDEIDIHLHPAWQRKILPVVKKLFKNAQIFVSTHSPFVVGSVDGAWVYKLKKEGQYSVLDGEPVLSEDAKSYRLILEEVFGIREQFGENIEKKLQEFYALRKEILENKRPIEDETFQNIINELAPQSIELESILAMELRQLERIKKIKQLQTAL